MSLLQRGIEDSIATTRQLASLEAPLERAAAMVSRCLTSGHKLLICGNGGSASDSTHFATEMLCRFVGDRRPFPAVCNDYGADEIFALETCFPANSYRL